MMTNYRNLLFLLFVTASQPGCMFFSSPIDAVKEISLSDVVYWESTTYTDKSEIEDTIEYYAEEHNLNADISLDQALKNNAEIFDFDYEAGKISGQSFVKLHYELKDDIAINLYFYTMVMNDAVLAKVEILKKGEALQFRGMDGAYRGMTRTPSQKIETGLVKNLFSNDPSKVYASPRLAEGIHTLTVGATTAKKS
ncbi:MAG: hypothetical protein KBT87_11145 [Gammaproteobacteria bacterium]|nr:hypothetical protein [Gammaproteobacteria bacterium]MBQ0775218.1 hypothetical protein [Gammaproteobacteria bacterium]